MGTAGKGELITPGEGKTFPVGDSRITIKLRTDDTGQKYEIIEATLPPGFDSPPHVHQRMEQAFYVLEGEVDSNSTNRQYEPERELSSECRPESHTPSRIPRGCGQNAAGPHGRRPGEDVRRAGPGVSSGDTDGPGANGCHHAPARPEPGRGSRHYNGLTSRYFQQQMDLNPGLRLLWTSIEPTIGTTPGSRAQIPPALSKYV